LNVFALRDRIIGDYASYIRSFVRISEPRIRALVEQEIAEGLLWPQPLIQLNPSFEPGPWVDDLVEQQVLHAGCGPIFRRDKSGSNIGLRLHKHQADAIRIARAGHPYVLTTGTGSGKSLAYIIPIVDHVLRSGSGRGVQAVVVYPMNALANSQMRELEKFLCDGFPNRQGPVTFKRYTGQESREERDAIIASPPDIILTNFVMLELMLTRSHESKLLRSMSGLKYLVLDELHTYRGRQGSDVAVLARRVREITAAPGATLQCVGTSATIAGRGTQAQRREQVARLASQLFGTEVRPAHIIGETLRRATPERNWSDPTEAEALRARLRSEEAPSGNFEAFVQDPLASWIESAFGIEEHEEEGHKYLRRSQPASLSGPDGATPRLAALSGMDEETCARRTSEMLLAGFECEPHPQTGKPPFAFRLHQWVSRGDTAYASLEPPSERVITLQGQRFVPGQRDKILFPLAFCRECGHEFYTVWKLPQDHAGEKGERFTPRPPLDTRAEQADEPDAEAGFLYFSESDPWPHDEEQALAKLPESWIEEKNGNLRVKPGQRENVPRPLRLDTLGHGDSHGLRCHWMASSLRFCPACGVSYDRQRSDFAKLSSLGSEGRSTATTILSLSFIQALRADADLNNGARKLLSFTDNRQDASLQAGHFNDFIETSLLRAALYSAALEAGSEGLTHDVLARHVFDALDLPVEEYASNPEARYAALEQAQAALRGVLGYRLYRDLRRGWRVTSPNLEQCGLLEIDYQSLDEIAADEELWELKHPALSQAEPSARREVCKVLLDVMRRELAIKVSYLQPGEQESLLQRASQYLKPPPSPWNFDDDEARTLEQARVLFPRPRDEKTPRDSKDIFLSPRSAFGSFARRKLFPSGSPKPDDVQAVICDLLQVLQVGGLVEPAHATSTSRGRSRWNREPKEDEHGFQLVAASLIWRAGDGTKAFHDPLRSPRAAREGGRANTFFSHFYKSVAATLEGIEAREHTAQVPYGERQDREARFTSAQLPILYCSPTMELGVDIAELNAVHLRNVPPTPANYAQRSGRAGRSGQPAIVWSYCTTGSPHDQYFFRRPIEMVAGAVAPPRLDLSNEELVRAHVHAVWLHETGADLSQSMKDVLDLNGDDPTLQVLAGLSSDLRNDAARERARPRAQRILDSMGEEVLGAPWFHEGWLERTLREAPQSFERACERWRGLYRSALSQARAQSRLVQDASRPHADKEQAKRLRAEAESQLRLLSEVADVEHSDFYPYRYFAAEGFLPGYNFPRLPLSAFIPARRAGKANRDEYLSRPRFLAITEFGPRALVYHEGARYVIHKVILPLSEGAEGEAVVQTTSCKICSSCGYGHPVTSTSDPDLCDRCGTLLPFAMKGLLRMQNVSAKRRDKINSDEEERLKLGYEIITSVRWAERNGQAATLEATAKHGEEELAGLSYGQAATLWRINLGWRRRKDLNQHGFMLDIERGYWEKNEREEKTQTDDDLSRRIERVVPFVEDTRNCLLFAPAVEGVATPPQVLESDAQASQLARSESFMPSLASALKRALLVRYQLEDNELAVEPLPSPRDPKQLLFYEASEGGAGALKHLCENSHALAEVAEEALKLCHFEVPSGADLRRAKGAREECEAACYDCLLSYGNQSIHSLLDRHCVRDYLLALRDSALHSAPSGAATSPGGAPSAKGSGLDGSANGSAGHPPEQIAQEQLERRCDSDLEKEWLSRLAARGHRLPHEAQKYLPGCGARPDFFYPGVAVYIDGPHHEFPERRERDRTQTECLENDGFSVVRFGLQDDWSAIWDAWPSVFGAVGAQRVASGAGAGAST